MAKDKKKRLDSRSWAAFLQTKNKKVVTTNRTADTLWYHVDTLFSAAKWLPTHWMRRYTDTKTRGAQPEKTVTTENYKSNEISIKTVYSVYARSKWTMLREKRKEIKNEIIKKTNDMKVSKWNTLMEWETSEKGKTFVVDESIGKQNRETVEPHRGRCTACSLRLCNRIGGLVATK